MQTASLPPPCQGYSQARWCDGWRSGLWYGHTSFCCLFWQRWLFIIGILLSVNTPGKKSQRNTEKASGFPFAAREIISRMENRCHELTGKEHLDLHHGCKVCWVPGCTCFFRTWASRASQRQNRAQKSEKPEAPAACTVCLTLLRATVYLTIFWTQTISSRASVSGCPP